MNYIMSVNTEITIKKYHFLNSQLSGEKRKQKRWMEDEKRDNVHDRTEKGYGVGKRAVGRGS